MLNQFREQKTMSGLEYKTGSVSCLYTPVSPSVPKMQSISAKKLSFNNNVKRIKIGVEGKEEDTCKHNL